MKAKELDKKFKNLLCTEFEDGDRAYFYIQNKYLDKSFEIIFEFKLSLYEIPQEDVGDDTCQLVVNIEEGSETLKWLNPKSKKGDGKVAKGSLGGMGMGGMGGMLAQYEIAERSYRPYKVKINEV